MKYSEWMEKVWQAIDERWEEMGDQERAAGIPCDAAFLEELGISAVEPTARPQNAGEAVEAAYGALKSIEEIGLLLEVKPRRFKLVDSAPRQLGRPLSPLLEPYKHQPLEQEELEFLARLSELAAGTDEADPYVRIEEQRVSDIFKALGWAWQGTLDRRAIGITQTLKMEGMIATSFAAGETRCVPTYKGMIRVEQ